MAGKGLSSVASNNLKGAIAGVTALLLLATGAFLYASKGEEYPHVTIIASYVLLTLSVVSVILLIVLSIYDSRVDRIIELTNAERDKAVDHYKGLVSTLEIQLDASNVRDVARLNAQSRTYGDTEKIGNWRPVTTNTESTITSGSPQP